MSKYRNFTNFKRKLKKQEYILFSPQQLLNYKGEDIPASKVKVVLGNRLFTLEKWYKFFKKLIDDFGEYLCKILPDVVQTVNQVLTTAIDKQTQALYKLQEDLKNGG